MTAYTLVLALHSWNRWLVLVLALVLLVRSAARWRSDPPGAASLDRLSTAFIISVDVQLLLGLALYFGLSPTVRGAASGLSDAVTRFWVAEHPALMILAIVVAHVGVGVRRRREGAARHRAIVIALGVFLLLVLAGIPWPGMPAGRALFMLP